MIAAKTHLKKEEAFIWRRNALEKQTNVDRIQIKPV